MTSRRQMVWGGAVLAAAVAAGCRADPSETAAPGGQEAGAPAERVVTDSTGEVHIRHDVTRIVTVHHIATQPLLDLGIVPVGRGDVAQSAVDPSAWPQIADIPVVTNGGEINVEHVVELDPDLIIAHNRVDERVLDSLRQITTVLVVDIAGAGRADWQGKTQLLAEAVGKETDFEALVTSYQDHAASIARTHAEVLSQETFSVVGTWSFGEVIVYSADSNFGNVSALAGAQLVAPLGTPEDGEHLISLEEVGDHLSGSIVLHASDYLGEPNPELTETMESPVFTQLPTVKDGRVFPGGKATLGGFQDARLALDSLDAALSALQ